MSEPTLTQRPAPTCVLGLAASTDNAAEAQPAAARIPSLWARFAEEHWFERLERAGAVGSPLAVYSDYQTNASGEYRILVGREVPCGAEPLAGLQSVSISPGPFLRFRFRGPLPHVVIDAWHQVWTYFEHAGPHRRSYTADLETYHDDGAGVDIWIAVC